MIIRHEHLAKQLAGTPRSLYVVFGDDPVAVTESSDAIRKFASQTGFTERYVIVADARYPWDELLSSGENRSLFGDKKLLDLRIPSGSPGKQGSDAIKSYVSKTNPDVMTLVVLPELDWQAKKAAWFLALDAAGLLVECVAPTRDQLPTWISRRLAKEGYSADKQTLEWLADRLVGNLRAAQQEIYKITLLHKPGPISFEQVRDAVVDSSRFDIDDVVAALHQADLGTFVRALEGVRDNPDGGAKELLVWNLANEIRTLMTVKKAASNGGNIETALREAKVFGDRKEPIKQAIKSYTFAQLLAGLKAMIEVDKINKGVMPGDIWLEMTRMGISMIGRIT